ncbi:MAG: 30S ribosomal protein S15 [Bdellovibrio sp.]
MMTAAQKKEIVQKIGSKFGKGPNDTGSASVQIALMTARINELMGHFEKHKKDHHSNRGLLKLIGRRRSLLRYVQQNDEKKYQDLIIELGLRK